ncbi:unnamed protein product [Paramecium octaurelia]|uniref:Protein kinase domain-containing protein n=1 Tax=Paramecium octaurelia TaxID=43137 RepID=A0A8S1UV75_PAROT|nr:unnamed protein product [Paramecium octaurelia]
MMQMDIDQFFLLQLISKGTYAKVYLVKKKDTNKLYALKKLKKKVVDQKKQAVQQLNYSISNMLRWKKLFLIKKSINLSFTHNIHFNRKTIFTLLQNTVKEGIYLVYLEQKGNSKRKPYNFMQS